MIDKGVFERNLLWLVEGISKFLIVFGEEGKN